METIMKAIVPHPFFRYAAKFTLNSMVAGISNLSYSIFNKPNNKWGRFLKEFNYSVKIGSQIIQGKTTVSQTWLIDLLYCVISQCEYGEESISELETLHLVSLYNDYYNCSEILSNKPINIWLYVYGFFGEQKQFQTEGLSFDNFAREKYILDIISKKTDPEKVYNLNIQSEFQRITGYSTDDYSFLLNTITFSFVARGGMISPFTLLHKDESILTKENQLHLLDLYSTDIDSIRSSSLKRQFLYVKPIIKLGDLYYSVNAHLMLALFVNSNYWVLRNHYLKIRSQVFLNAFGVYFERYVEELLNYCLEKNQYTHVQEVNDEKRADWLIEIDNYNFIVEQKSSLSILGIKQTQTDINAIKQHILKNWGEAVRQLSCTQSALEIEKPIKVILVYEDYFKAECLDELFALDTSLRDDRSYWLLNIREFEMLMYAYKTSPDIFREIVDEKLSLEHELSHSGREIERLFSKRSINQNQYLRDSGIITQFEQIKQRLRDYKDKE